MWTGPGSDGARWRNPGDREQCRSVEIPKFASHLPEGAFLDWAFALTSGRVNFSKTAGAETVRQLWSQLDEASAVRAASRAEDPELLDWIAAHSEDRPGVRGALLSNPVTWFSTVQDLLVARRENRDRELLERSRSTRDLGELVVRGLLQAEHPRQAVQWMAGYAAEIPGEQALTLALHATEEQYQPEFLAELLRTDPSHARFDLGKVATLMYELGPHLIRDGMWRLLGAHVIARATPQETDDLLVTSGSTAFRGELLTAGTITLEHATRGLDETQVRTLLKRLPPERTLTLEEVTLVAEVGLTAEEWHERRFEPDAAAWAADNPIESLSAGAAWFTNSDPLLVRVLRRNTMSHRFASKHLWRLARLWGRLSNRTRVSIVATFGTAELAALGAGEIRAWIIAQGQIETVEALQLSKTEARALIERVERTLEPRLAWLAAKSAERPRDRIRMAEIGLREDPGWQRLKEWLRSSSSNEIVRLWHLAEPRTRDDISGLLVGLLQRSTDDIAWVDKLLPELRTDWQNAPNILQEHAGRWLSDNVASEEGRIAVWGLYAEWQGTLEELLLAADTL